MVIVLYLYLSSDKKRLKSVAEIQHLFFDNKWCLCYNDYIS